MYSCHLWRSEMLEKAIRTKELTKMFGNFTAVNHISFEVSKGEIFGFLGANGAGKTTAMKMLTGLLTPSSGEAEVAGFNVYKEPERIKKRIGYMSQKFSLYDDLTPIENIEFFGSIYGLNKENLKLAIDNILNKHSLQKVKDEVVKDLPQGWKQKLAFSISLIHDPDIVFLDEPTGGVDPITRRSFWEMIYEEADKGKTIFVTTHYMDEAEYCDRLSIMVDGRIEALGTPAGLKEEFSCKSINDLFVKLARPNEK